MCRRPVFLAILMAMPAGVAAAQQIPATVDISTCTLIVDPTAQRLCIESARQSRPASTFDPTAQKQRLEQRPPPRRDALSPAGTRGPARDAGARDPSVRPGAAPSAKPPEAYRDDKWRLQIP